MSTPQLTRVTSARRQALSVFRINWRDVLYVITGLISAAVDRPFVRTQADRARRRRPLSRERAGRRRRPSCRTPTATSACIISQPPDNNQQHNGTRDRLNHGVQYWTSGRALAERKCGGGEGKEEAAATGKLATDGTGSWLYVHTGTDGRRSEFGRSFSRNLPTAR